MKKDIIEDDILFASLEELEFYHWVQEAKAAGFIKEWIYQPSPYHLSDKKTVVKTVQLKTKTKEVEKHLLHPHEYTPDFIIFPAEDFQNLDHGLISTSNTPSYVIDVKGTFQRNDGARAFSINQKWVMEKYNIYINKVIPEKFFKLTWVPEKCRFSPKQKKLRQKYVNMKTLKDIVNENSKS